MMNFAGAMKLLYEGHRVTRKEWSPGNFILRRQTESQGVLAEFYADNGTSRFTWTPTQRDLQGEDWVLGPSPETITISTDGIDGFGPMGRR